MNKKKFIIPIVLFTIGLSSCNKDTSIDQTIYFVSPKGKIKGESTPLTEDTVTGTVYFKSSKTLYSMIGDVFVLVCFITIIYSLLRRPIDKQFVCLLNKIKNRFQKNNG